MYVSSPRGGYSASNLLQPRQSLGAPMMGMTYAPPPMMSQMPAQMGPAMATQGMVPPGMVPVSMVPQGMVPAMPQGMQPQMQPNGQIPMQGFPPGMWQSSQIIAGSGPQMLPPGQQVFMQPGSQTRLVSRASSPPRPVAPRASSPGRGYQGTTPYSARGMDSEARPGTLEDKFDEGDPIDGAIRSYLILNPDFPVSIKKVSPGFYDFGDRNKVHITKRGGHIVVRVGGGYKSLETFLDERARYGRSG
mmetsp:Transcript_38499/g.100788  ORF Transcript_38499/g.100788 Transcript_38499/m.100788 type:complete len:247 (+) Transcript_38499:40-780(+)